MFPTICKRFCLPRALVAIVAIYSMLMPFDIFARHVCKVTRQGGVVEYVLCSELPKDQQREITEIEINGLKDATRSASDDEAAPPSVVVWKSPEGFMVDGAINGYSVRFLVDTGADHVVISEEIAKRANIDLSRGHLVPALTASGITQAVAVTFANVSIGPIAIQHIRGMVQLHSGPAIALLGMSFLDHVIMTSEGAKMVLTKRF